jgi:glutamate dehydrogenase/leucine dehydrogenase
MYLRRICDLTGVAMNVVKTGNPNLALLSPNEFALAMEYNKLWHGCILKSNQQAPLFSHELFQDLYADIENDMAQGHEGLFFARGTKTRSLFIVSLWNTTRGMGSGGVRYKKYDTVYSQIVDTLRLSQGMGHKNALAGLWWGGGKGTIAKTIDDHNEWRRMVFEDWGEFVTWLNGCYYTAEDVGTTVQDMAVIASKTRFVNCVPQTMGGSGNPSKATARGVAVAMEAAWNARCQSTGETRSFEEISVGIQGLGNVGLFLVEELVQRGLRRIHGRDVCADKVVQAKLRFPLCNFTLEDETSSILFDEVDILSPCALGGILNSETIPRLRCKIVCGAANNQLLNPSVDDQKLFHANIVYIPDFVCNRMGIVNCSDEIYGYAHADRMQDPILTRHFEPNDPHSIYATVSGLVRTCLQEGIPTGSVATAMASKACESKHPIYPGRARMIQSNLFLQLAQASSKL